MTKFIINDFKNIGQNLGNTSCQRKISLICRRSFGVILFLFILHLSVTTSSVWYEERPDTTDPCNHVVVGPIPRIMLSVKHPSNCSRGGVMWYATYGRVHVHLDLEDGLDFVLCLTSGSTNKIYVWWENSLDSWNPISFQLSFGMTLNFYLRQEEYPALKTCLKVNMNTIFVDFVPRRDMCRVSRNGTMNLYLEPPWAEIFYESYVMWNITRGLTKEEALAEAASIAVDAPKSIYDMDDEDEEGYEGNEEEE